GSVPGRFARGQVPGHDWPEIRVCSRRRGAFVLAELRSNLVRGDHMCIGESATQLLRNRPLMRVVAVGVQQADRDRFRLDLRQRREVEYLELTLRPQTAAH